MCEPIHPLVDKNLLLRMGRVLFFSRFLNVGFWLDFKSELGWALLMAAQTLLVLLKHCSYIIKSQNKCS